MEKRRKKENAIIIIIESMQKITDWQPSKKEENKKKEMIDRKKSALSFDSEICFLFMLNRTSATSRQLVLKWVDLIFSFSIYDECFFFCLKRNKWAHKVLLFISSSAVQTTIRGDSIVKSMINYYVPWVLLADTW